MVVSNTYGGIYILCLLLSDACIFYRQDTYQERLKNLIDLYL